MTPPRLVAKVSRTGTALCAAALLLCALPVAAEPLGRLFFTPERRAALERQRQLNVQETQLVEGATLSVNGIVQSSNGRSTTWVNGVPQNDGGGTAGVRVDLDRKRPDRATVVDGEEAPASLKVGESINRATREKSSGIGNGQIEVRRPAPAQAR